MILQSVNYLELLHPMFRYSKLLSFSKPPITCETTKDERLLIANHLD